MQLKRTLGSLALATLMALPAAGCVVRARGNAHVAGPTVIIEEEPPAPRTVVVESRPGFIWIEGRYQRRGREWIWLDGRWDRERANQRWEQGRWERRGRGHVWVEGRWHAGASSGPVIRDHRPQPQPGPVIRDHRDPEPRPAPGPVIRDHR